MSQAFVESLESTLRQITSPATVKEASARLQNEFLNQPQSLPALIHVLQHASDANIRQLAGIEARKAVAKFWQEDGAVSNDTKAQIKHSLLQSTAREEHPLPRHTSARVISAIAQLDVDEGQWEELLPYIQSTVESGNAVEREVSVYILYTLLEAGIMVLIETRMVDVLHLLSRTVSDPDSAQVRVSSVLGLGSLADVIESSSVAANTPAQQNPIELFRALIPAMVDVLKQVIASDDEKGISQVFEVFSGLLLADPALMSRHFGDLMDFMLTHIAADRSLSDDSRIPALHFLMTAIRFKKNKVQALKLGPKLVAHFLEIIAEGYDEDDDEEDEETPPQMALRALDYLSASLPPTQVIMPLFTALTEYVHSQDANRRRAAFLAITAVVEGAPDFVANHIEVVLPTVINGLNDSETIVKSGALQALAELATELQEVVSDEHETLLPLVFNIMDGATTLKIGSHACQALDAIVEGIDRKVIVEKYLSSLAPKLLHLLASTQALSLKSSIVAALSSAAFASGPAFAPYFESTIRAVEPFVSLGADPENMTADEVKLCGISLDALSALAAAVGKEPFRPYVEPLVGAAYASMKSSQSGLKECAFLFVSSLAKVYRDEFSPFLAQVVPELFACLDQDEFAGLLDEDDAIGQDDEEDMLSKYKINGAVASEKAVAFESLADIIVATTASFTPYLETASQHFISGFNHFYDAVSRTAVLGFWRSVIAYYKASNGKWSPGLPAAAVSEPASTLIGLGRVASLELIANVDERSVATALCEIYALAIKNCGPVVLGTQDELETLCREVLLILTKNHPSQTMDEDDYEFDGKADAEEEHTESSEYDELLIDSALDVVVQLASALGAQFEPVATAVFPHIAKHATSPSATERASGIGALAEIVAGLRSAVTKYSDDLMSVFLKALQDKDLEVRSNAAYGVGLLCFHSEAESIPSHYPTILRALQRLLKKADKKRKSLGKGDDESDSNDRGLANACGCVARLTMKRPELIPIGEVFPVLLSRLPLQDGFEENTPVFELIIDLFQKQDNVAIEHRDQVVNLFSQVFTQHNEKAADMPPPVPGYENGTVLPFEDDEIKHKVIELLRYLESGQQGLVSGYPVLAQVL